MAKGKNTITIYGANGQLVQTITVSNNATTVSFDKYASGIYMVQVQAEDGQVAYKKIVKK
ncbi:MAG: T9SS type A sorting domain-containing protein [Ferruginibacter sp.]